VHSHVYTALVGAAALLIGCPPPNGAVATGSFDRTAVGLPPSGAHDPVLAFRDTATRVLTAAAWDGAAWATEAIHTQAEAYLPGVDVAIDAAGVPHVATADYAVGCTTGSGHYQLFVRYLTKTGGTWTEETARTDCFFASPSGPAVTWMDPRIALTPDGRPMIAYTHRSCCVGFPLPGPPSHLPGAVIRTGPGTWDDAATFPGSARGAVHALEIAPDGTRHALVGDPAFSLSTFSYNVILDVWSDDGTGWHRTTLEAYSGGSGSHVYGYDLAVGGDGRVGALYYHLNDAELRFVELPPFGPASSEVVGSTDPQGCGQIAYDDAEDVHALLRDPGATSLAVAERTAPGSWAFATIAGASDNAGTACDLASAG